MPEVTMPRLSDSMEEGTIVSWLKSEGDAVAIGEELVEIETDKATMAYAAEDEGVLRILALEGATVAVGAPIAQIGEVASAAPDPGSPEPRTTSAEDRQPAVEPPRAAGPTAGQANGRSRDRVKASPLARRIATQLGVELSQLVGSGPAGRIIKADVLASAQRRTPAASKGVSTEVVEYERQIEAPIVHAPRPLALPASELRPEPAAGDQVQPLTRLQQTIAQRMAASRAQVPDFTVSADVDAGALVEFRARLKAATSDGAAAPSLNDMIVKASALALRQHPRANSSYSDGSVVLHSSVNVGFAVAGEGTLVVPVVADADLKSIGRIASEARRLAERARDGSITPAELSGGTFTVSNLGMFGMFDCVPVINGSQAAILGVGALRQEPVVVDGAVTSGSRMRLTLVGDHRVLYGSDAAELLASIRSILENPLTLAF
jgi:pyruvate dehydrogenase E2 component (dihydrolipoamide acetyltransferase)